jgi:hypothetical protein
MKIVGTIFSEHIERPIKEFYIEVLRAPVWNVYMKPSRLEFWKVLAETPEGAIRIAEYHFYRSMKSDIRLISREVVL